MELLILLISRHGELVSRDEIIERIWGKDVFVETEHSVNTAVRKVRQTLGDDPENSRFIQTVIGKGYRFTAAVTNGVAGPAVPQEQKQEELKPTAATRSRAKGKLIGIGVMLLLLFGLANWRLHRNSIERPFEIVPLAGLTDYEAAPSFSPDGNHVAFVVRGVDNSGVYTALVDGEKPLRLTTNTSDQFPVWSPDGREIAFARASEEGQAIYMIPSLGGTEHRVYSGPASAFPHSLSWSPSGEALAFSESRADRTHARISQLSLSNFSIRPLTFPSEQEIDYAPAFSPDGSTLAFVRSVVTGNVSDLYAMPVKGGEAKRLTYSNRAIAMQLTWTEDGSEIVFCSDRGGVLTLWRVSASGGTPRPIEGVGAGACSPTVSRKGSQLAYQQMVRRHGIWRLKLDDPVHGLAPSVQIVSAKGVNHRPDFSPDGKRIAFESDRLGYQDIWICDSNGSNCGQLTSLHGVASAAQWSPDGHHIAFEFRPKDHSEIFIVDAPGGSPRLLPTLSGSDNGGPSWSRDGKWIYFYSDKGGGPLQLWKVQFDGGAPVQVTTKGGVFARESIDRQFLYYSKWDMPGLWKMPIQGGPESRILDQPDGSDWFNWGLTSRGVYFIDSHTQSATIKFFEFASGKEFSIFVPAQQPNMGLAVSSDGNYILYVQPDLAESSIMVVKNFH